MQYPLSDPGAQLYNGKFTDGIPASGVPTSIDRAAHMNAVYDELIAIVVAAGLTPSETTLNQVLQAINTLLAAAIATRAPSSHGHLWSQISGIPTTFPPSAHNQDWGTITGKPAVYPPADHTQDWSTITGKPATFPPSAHTHNFADTAGNADMLDGYHAADIINIFSSYLPNLQGSNTGQRGCMIGIITGGAVQMPAGGTWFHYVIGFWPDGNGREGMIGYHAGGTVLNVGGNGMNYGFAIKVA